jgi:hypothetical protein
MLELHLIYDYGYKLEAFKLCHKLLDIEESTNLILFLFFLGSQIPCGWLLFKINQVILIMEFLKYYEFCVLNLIRLCLEKEE